MIYEETRNKIKEKMKEKRISCVDIAIELNVTRQAVNVVLQGKATSRKIEYRLLKIIEE